MILDSLKSGLRLERPEICTTELYDLMLKCWLENPTDRPTFQDIKDQLDMKKRKIYVDFDVLNPSYVFPPTNESDTWDIFRTYLQYVLCLEERQSVLYDSCWMYNNKFILLYHSIFPQFHCWTSSVK